MKKASLVLLALLLSLTARQADGQQAHGIVEIPIAQLRAAYRASFGQNPDLGNYAELALAINRAKGQYFPGAAGGFWNGMVTQVDDNRDHDTFSIVTIGKGPFAQNPQSIPVRALGGAFANVFGRRPALGDYQDLAVSIDRFQAQTLHCSGGFWNGEQPLLNGLPSYGIVWIASANGPQNIPVAELAASFEAKSQRAPNFNVYADMAFAVTCWIGDHEKGQALGGFWNGEKARSDQGMVYGIVLVR
jgi:hypothetical protein